MLDEREIDIEIARLEYAESSYPNYAKLADLYTIKNQMHKGEEIPSYPSYSTAPASSYISSYGDSEFLSTIVGKDDAAIWMIMDDLMDTLKTVNTKVYNRVLEKISRV